MFGSAISPNRISRFKDLTLRPFHADLEGFFDGYLLTREDKCRGYGEDRYQSIGIFNGVPLFIVWTPRGEEGDIAHLISARKATNHEYKAWLARFAKH